MGRAVNAKVGCFETASTWLESRLILYAGKRPPLPFNRRNLMPDILPGLKGLSNLHPLFVHFPIAFWLAALTSILALILCVVAFFGRRYSGRVLRVVFFVGLL